MSNNLTILLAILCFLNAIFAYRFPRETQNVANSSDKFTQDELDNFRTQLLTSLPAAETNKITNIFSKFTVDKTSNDNVEGFVKLLVWMYEFAVKRNSRTEPDVEMLTTKSNEFKLKLEKAIQEEKDLQGIKSELDTELPSALVDPIINVYSNLNTAKTNQDKFSVMLDVLSYLLEINLSRSRSYLLATATTMRSNTT